MSVFQISTMTMTAHERRQKIAKKDKRRQERDATGVDSGKK